MHSRLEVAVLKDARGFASLEEEWSDLYRNCGRSAPFQSWAWLYSWWESYGRGNELRLVTLRSEEEGCLLAGLIPLMLERRWGSVRTPSSEVTIDGPPHGGKTVGQEPPSAAAFNDVEDGVKALARARESGFAVRFGSGHIGLQVHPLLIGDIRRVRFSHTS